MCMYKVETFTSYFNKFKYNNVFKANSVQLKCFYSIQVDSRNLKLYLTDNFVLFFFINTFYKYAF